MQKGPWALHDASVDHIAYLYIIMDTLCPYYIQVHIIWTLLEFSVIAKKINLIARLRKKRSRTQKIICFSYNITIYIGHQCTEYV